MVSECTPSFETDNAYSSVVGPDVAPYVTACETSNGDLLVWNRPTDAGCEAWYKAMGDDYSLTPEDMASASWVEACYKAGALNLTVLGATAVAAIATLAF